MAFGKGPSAAIPLALTGDAQRAGRHRAAAHAAMAFDNQDNNGDNAVTKDEYAAKWTARFNQAQQGARQRGPGRDRPDLDPSCLLISFPHRG